MNLLTKILLFLSLIICIGCYESVPTPRDKWMAENTVTNFWPQARVHSSMNTKTLWVENEGKNYLFEYDTYDNGVNICIKILQKTEINSPIVLEDWLNRTNK